MDVPEEKTDVFLETLLKPEPKASLLRTTSHYCHVDRPYDKSHSPKLICCEAGFF